MANPNVVEESVTIYLLDDGRVEEVTIKDLRPMRREWMVTPSKSLLLVVKGAYFSCYWDRKSGPAMKEV